MAAGTAGLVGRAAELGRLTGMLDQAATAAPVVALISGDAGVGKTRLAAELAQDAAARGFTVLSGRCAELGDSVPYLPLADAIRGAVSGPGADARLLEAVAARPVLARLLPDGGAAPAGSEPGEIARQQLFGAVLGLLAELAGRAPVLLVMEDLHWADRSTRDLLTFLSRVLHRESIMIVGTYRADELHRGHPLRAMAAELTRLPGVTAMSLRPLPDDALAQHLTALAGRPLPAAELGAILARAEGNAYYAEELLAAAAAGSELPADLADLLLARVQRLSPHGQQVLRTAAVAGRRVQDEVISSVCGLPPADYERAVREAVASQLLVVDADQGYAFRHALLREAVYADLLPGERTRLHARLAELLSAGGQPDVPGTAAELAQHALASHDIAGGFAASVRAGREAERVAAPAEAHRHFDQALALWERVPGPEQLAGMSRGQLAWESANNAAASGDITRAVQQLRRLTGLLDASADPVLASRSSERLSFFLLELGERGAAADAARAAIDALPAGQPSWERARALATYAHTLLYAENLSPAREMAQQARLAAQQAAALSVEADTLVTLGLLDERAGHPDQAVSLFTMAHEQSRDAGALGVHLRAAFQKARIHLERGDLAAASGTAHAGLHRAEQAGLSLAPYGLDLQYLHYLTHFADGAWDHAQQLADGFPVRVSSGREAVLSAMALFIDVARGTPAVPDRRAWLEQQWHTDSFAEYLGRGLLAEHALWSGDAHAAAAQAQAAIDVEARSSGYAPPLIRVAAVGLAAQADLAERARAAGDEAAARAATGAAEALIGTARDGAAHRSRPASVLGVDGRGWLARAEAEWARARGRNDPGAWRQVLAEFGPGYPYETARSRWRLAEALAAAGARQEARGEWQRAAAAADQLGARPLRSALADLARRARLDPAGQRGAAPGGDAPSRLGRLTARESEVLRLVAAGRSNREIAGALFIAPKTASVHVSNILAKLGASTRTEAAAIAHAEGPVLAAPERAAGGPDAAC
ncbi:MAG: helix-turn-helix transcriptional regulator [Streptosporangiaceae bacterium]